MLLSTDFLLVTTLQLVVPMAIACTDNDAKIAELAASISETEVSGCADVGDLCEATGQQGVAIRKWCCATCGTGSGPGTSLPPAEDDDPLEVFLLSGQSECTGSASAAMLNEEGNEAYPLLVGTQSGVWFASWTNNRFFIAPMQAGKGRGSFGPEISFGQRVHEATGSRVMVIKYCWGGSSVAKHWNPDTVHNSWDHDKDDGTAAWLEANGPVDFTNKNSLFANLVHVARLTTEALTLAGVAYVWKAFVWVQGSADKLDTWQNIGMNTARLFDAVREHAVGIWDLPIVDTGSSAQFSLRSGKAYAGQLVKGCKVTTIEMGIGAENPDSTCQITPGNPCMESTFFNADLFNHYGWDPNFPQEFKPLASNDKTFKWYKAFPTDLHSEYEGMVLKGRMLAGEYIRAFTTTALPATMAAEDPALLFPWPKCTPTSAKPTAEALCWMDQRGEAQAMKTCVPRPPLAGSLSSSTTTEIKSNGPSSFASAGRQVRMSLVASAVAGFFSSRFQLVADNR